MVTDKLLDWLLTPVTWIASLLPTSTAHPLDSWDTVLGHLSDLNYFLPISEVFAFTIGVFVLFPALMGTSFIVWLIALIRGGSARG